MPQGKETCLPQAEKNEAKNRKAMWFEYNSSKPPLSDFGKLKKTNSLKTGSGKKVGGQPGHKGSSMKMTSSPDFTEIHNPSYCNCCGNDLSGIESELIGKRQVLDIPEIALTVTEHRFTKGYVIVAVCLKEVIPMGLAPPSVMEKTHRHWLHI